MIRFPLCIEIYIHLHLTHLVFVCGVVHWFAPAQATSGAEVRVATEKSMTKESGERIVYIKGTPFQREKALDMIRSNPKVRLRL